jgi:FAD/FMN-containing dehydrogenase
MRRRTFIRSTFAAAAAATIPARQSLAAFYQDAPADPGDVSAVTGTGEKITLKGKDIADLSSRLRGRLLFAGDEGYEKARHILNPSFDKRPALIAQVTGTADVRTAVDFARENSNLLLAVKCGGHSSSGKSTCDGGMMIDMSHFRDVRVDPNARRAWVTGGSLLGQLDHESMAYDLVAPMGTVSHTGVGGLVTGGGFGRLARRFGMSIDNLAAVDVVTADGQLRHANEDENPDLYWGVRGGGGNFGVVTSFEFRLHPMQRQVLGGPIFFPLDKARDVLNLYADYGPEAPDELQLDLIMYVPAGGQPGMVGFGICYSGPANAADRALAPIRKVGTPMVDAFQATDYVALQRSGDSDDPRAEGTYLKGGFVSEIPAGLISAIIENFEGHPERSTAMFFQQSGGAIGWVANDATAFSSRDAIANMLAFVGWRHGEDPSEHIRWVKQYWTGLEKFTQGFYTNDLEVDHPAAKVAANYRGNYDRLVQVKNKYDPSNLFQLNANVQPTV